MPGLRILCLHGQGSNTEIMKAQLGPITKLLKQNGVATFEWLEGTIPTEAGPGVSGVFEDEQSIREACEDLEDYLEENGPYDGILGFSQGSTLLAEFLCDFARRNPGNEPPCRCAIFMNGIPPYRMGDDEKPIIDYGLLEHFPSIPTLHVVGKKDFVYEYSTILQASTASAWATLIAHEKGHEISNDTRIVQKINSAFEQMSIRIALGC
uniref:Hydrolase phiM n=1 Tax=Fungal sp. (strain ATCC 74256) TaxID=1729595 RepID=PHIM_FUNX7|nr:RecName: Full=Hydrolase phiM; AltName: Full=Phomoidride biosynthesis cluster protein M [fungal sp. ATCC 74256]BBG28510.1 putative DUF341 family protein [fungal sp. ATCC 74256]